MRRNFGVEARGSLREFEARGGLGEAAELAGEVREGERGVLNDGQGVGLDREPQGCDARGEGGVTVAFTAQCIGLDGEGEGLKCSGGRQPRYGPTTRQCIGVSTMAEVLASELDQGQRAFVGRSRAVVGDGGEIDEQELRRQRE